MFVVPRILAPRMLALAIAGIVILAGCAPTGSESHQVEPSVRRADPVLQTYPGIRVIENLDYGALADATSGGPLLDVCLPDTEAQSIPAGTTEPETSLPRAAVLSIHGGSWREGDKSNVHWRAVCQWLASEGFVALSVNYRLAPANPYPAGIEDLRQAVRWLREPAQVGRFDIDPDRIGAFGGSAGGNLATQLGLEGDGDLTEGSRVAAVVDLSGPMDLTTAGFSLGGVLLSFRMIQLDYLGCVSYADCPQARQASPLYDIDATDPPFFVGHSLDERIPIEQSNALVDGLRDAGVDTAYVTVPGTLHSIAMLDDAMRERIGEWLRSKLAP